MGEQHDGKLTAIYDGYVVDNKDPKGLGRVRVCIPGVAEPSTNWANPVGAPGAGGELGFFFVPKIGDDVQCYFGNEGDPDSPRFLTGGWGAPAGKTATPSFVRDLPIDEVLQVQGIETDRWQIVFDQRKGKESLVIRDRLFETDIIEIDGVNHGIRISGSLAVLLESTGSVVINALQIILNGRVVRDTSEPI